VDINRRHCKILYAASRTKLNLFKKELMRNYTRRLVRRLPQPINTLLLRIYNRFAGYSHRKWATNVFGRENMTRRERLFLTVAAFVHTNRPVTGYYFEFGCNNANTMRLAYDTFHRLVDWDYVAFDSFEGLPEIQEIDRQQIWGKGLYAITEKKFTQICISHGIPRDKLITVPGFYEQSLNEQTRERLAGNRAAFIYVDCDLYHSTVPVLNFCKKFLQQGTVIAFDDWNCFLADPNKGERRAWTEFLEGNPELHFESFLETGMQKAFVCTKIA
jgi:O-methyltransferase